MAERPAFEHLLSLAGRRALITGAAGGIGLAIARRFAEAGACLVLVDVNGAALSEASATLARRDGDVVTQAADLARKPAIDALWDGLRGREPDILVNNAGIYPFRPFTDVDESLYAAIMDTNLASAFWMCQRMIQARGGAGGIIINLGSIEAVLPFKDDAATYSVSKAGVIALTRALAREHARHGFRVNAILPGGIVTPGTKAAAKRIVRGDLGLVKDGIAFAQRLPAGRAGDPDEVARVALALASDIGSYIHGAVIPVDGGFLSA